MNDKVRSYNERLFAGGIRSRLHYARFHWLQRSLKRLHCQPRSVLELGCFDAKTISFLPILPERYVGVDANWEGGLDLARRTWRDERFEFIECDTADGITVEEPFDISICMEMLECVPPHIRDGYIQKLAQLTTQYIFVTTSNQKGLGFAAKYSAKRLLGHDVPAYTVVEFLAATAGQMQWVRKSGRKGWDYNEAISCLSKYFHIMEVAPYPIRYVPTSLGFGVSIIGEVMHSSHATNNGT